MSQRADSQVTVSFRILCFVNQKNKIKPRYLVLTGIKSTQQKLSGRLHKILHAPVASYSLVLNNNRNLEGSTVPLHLILNALNAFAKVICISQKFS